MRFGWTTTALALGALVLTASASVTAQKVLQTSPGKAGSPHVTVEYKIDGATVTVSYGRPFVKGRPLSAVAPDGQAYRVGADEATVLVTDKSLMFGSLMVPPGKYSLWAFPKGGKWELVVNKQTGQWGTNYDAKEDFGRSPLVVSKAPKADEQFTILLEDTKDGGQLSFQWGDEKLSTAFMVH